MIQTVPAAIKLCPATNNTVISRKKHSKIQNTLLFGKVICFFSRCQKFRAKQFFNTATDEGIFCPDPQARHAACST